MMHIGRDALTATLRAIRDTGHGCHESAVFWLGSDTPKAVSTIVVPAGPGVEWHHSWLRLSVEWMVALTELCETRREMVVGTVHSHPREAFFSDMDADAFFHAPDCLSVVLPRYGKTSIRARKKWAVVIGEIGGFWRGTSWSEQITIEGELPHEVIRLEAHKT